MLKTCMIATPSLVSHSIRETAPRRCKFAVAFLRSAWPWHHTCGCVQQPRLTLAPPAVARLAISGGIRCYDCFPKNPSSPVAPAQSRRRPALCSAAALSQLCLDLVALPARVPPLRPLYSQAAGSVTVTAPVARPASRPTCPAAPAPLRSAASEPHVPRVTFACSSMPSWVGLFRIVPCIGSESRLDPEPWRGANA